MWSWFCVYFIVLGGGLAVVSQGQGDGLVKNFYQKTCPHAETIVREVTWRMVARNPHKLPAGLLRLHFHDCFIRGCDASILLNSNSTGSRAEKDSPPNFTLHGYEAIDQIKDAVEKNCSGIVSCADILALAARDAVSFEYQKPMWDVLTGRRDGIVSKAAEALLNIPQAGFDFSALMSSFEDKGLTRRDLVVLSGGHTIGIGHCNFFGDRVFDFTGNNDADPSLNPKYVTSLKRRCDSATDSVNFVPIDYGKGNGVKFDNNYYRTLKNNRGLFTSDATLLTDPEAAKIVDEMRLDGNKFFSEFGKSMVKMGAIEVLTGTDGEIRNKCGALNGL